MEQRPCGLIGGSLGHSFSPQLHGMLGDYSYRLWPLTAEELPAFLEGRQFAGLNVTIPYKQTVIPYCGELSHRARRIGSVNTLIPMPDGSLYGENTDYDGFAALADRAGIDFKGRKVVILGSGGTSRTVRTVAEDRGASQVMVVSRKGPVTYEDLKGHQDAEILVNTTPVGMYPHNGELLVDPGDFPRCAGVLDVVYNPLKTAFILRAEELGFPCAGGLLMLAAQAWRAAELFTGKAIPWEKCEAAFRQLERQRRNIVLVGMPGCGKTAVGQFLARQLGRPLVDTDQMVEQKAGRSIPEIFGEEGEEGFRRRETEAIGEAGSHTGAVIAIGGGGLLREENGRALAQNGLLVFLRRPVELLAREGRPLSTGLERLREMYQERLPIYERWAQLSVDNTGEVADTAAAIIKEWEK